MSYQKNISHKKYNSDIWYKIYIRIFKVYLILPLNIQNDDCKMFIKSWSFENQELLDDSVFDFLIEDLSRSIPKVSTMMI